MRGICFRDGSDGGKIISETAQMGGKIFRDSLDGENYFRDSLGQGKLFQRQFRWGEIVSVTVSIDVSIL